MITRENLKVNPNIENFFEMTIAVNGQTIDISIDRRRENRKKSA
jgi:hypothetical protein